MTDKITYRGSNPEVTITRQRCQKCPECGHTESVTLTAGGDTLTVYPPFAAAFWDVASEQARRRL